MLLSDAARCPLRQVCCLLPRFCEALRMHFLSAHCRVCKGDQFRAVPPETWLERVVLPRLFLCPGTCITCHKRRYLPTFQRWTAIPNTWR